MTTRTVARRAGFTLIELLVVILIIAVLAGLLLAGFSAARTAARKAAAKVEITQIDAAIGAFKAKMQVTFIPAFGSGPKGGFLLKQVYTGSEPEFTYLRQVFPQIKMGGDNGLDPALAGELDPNKTLFFFLTGPNQQGFSTNKEKPFTPSTGTDSRVGPFLETKSNKFQNGWYVDPWGTPYAYFSFDPSVNNYPTGGWPRFDPSGPANPTLTDLHPTENVPMLATQPTPTAVKLLTAYVTPGTPSRALNQKGWQIVSAGPDQVFGVGGSWVPGQGEYVSNGVGADDISNFNDGPLNQQSK